MHSFLQKHGSVEVAEVVKRDADYEGYLQRSRLSTLGRMM